MALNEKDSNLFSDDNHYYDDEYADDFGERITRASDTDDDSLLDDDSTVDDDTTSTDPSETMRPLGEDTFHERLDGDDTPTTATTMSDEDVIDAGSTDGAAEHARWRDDADDEINDDDDEDVLAR